jgi:hypothetical protein
MPSNLLSFAANPFWIVRSRRQWLSLSSAIFPGNPTDHRPEWADAVEKLSGTKFPGTLT